MTLIAFMCVIFYFKVGRRLNRSYHEKSRTGFQLRIRGRSRWVIRTIPRTLALLSVILTASAWLLFGHVRVEAANLETGLLCSQCEETDRFVRLQGAAVEPRMGTARPFTHPFVLSPEEWVSLLRELHVQRQSQGLLLRDPPGPIIPAFTAEEIGYLSATLSKAFAQAKPNEWVVFGLSGPTTHGMAKITTGGWFVEGSSLHLILANYRKAVTMRSTRESLWEHPLRPDEGADYDLVAGTHHTIVRAPTVSSSLFSSPPAELAIAYQAALLGQTTDVSTLKAPATLAPEVDPASLSIEDRLRALKQLHAQGLITEEEYRAKKQQILDRF